MAEETEEKDEKKEKREKKVKTLLNRSAVRKYIAEQGLRISGEAFDVFERKFKEIVDEAVKTTNLSRRKTVSPDSFVSGE